MSVDSPQLSPRQAHALFDVLSHHSVYNEIENFKNPGAAKGYGRPFAPEPGKPSNTPSLQPLLARFVLCLPGLKDVNQEFWETRVATIMEDLQEAELSESYDKGVVGIRRTVATAMAALFEYPSRGIYAGFDRPEETNDKLGKYDLSSADDLNRGFREFMRQAVYGDIVDKAFKMTAESDKLKDHDILTQTCHEFGLVNLASFMHYALILSPKGQNLLTLVDHANKLVPYSIIKQTVKIGNVATMINAMMKVVLAKVSVSTVTNWIGITQGADEGMNLMQQVISTVLSWDIRDLKSRATKIEKSKGAPAKDQCAAIKEYLTMSRAEHDSLRDTSLQSNISIVQAILSTSSASTSLSDSQHSQLLDYLSIHLSIRDREQIIKVLCHSQPDHLTQAVRDVVAAYEPIIRQVHNAVDLSDAINDFEVFLRDMIKISKMPDPVSSSSSLRKNSKTSPPPTVGDYVLLLKRHQYSLHKFLHQVAKNAPQVMSKFKDYADEAIPQFRQQNEGSKKTGAGDLAPMLHKIYTELPKQTQKDFLPLLDAHAAYIDKLHTASASRLRVVVKTPPSRSSSQVRGEPTLSPAVHAKDLPTPGPGAFLARWQQLLDATAITPAQATGGRVRHGSSGSVLKASAKGVDAGLTREEIAANAEGAVLSQTTSASVSAAGSATVSQTGSRTGSMYGDSGPKKGEASDNDDDDDDIFEEAQERLDELGLDGEQTELPNTLKIYEALGVRYREELARLTCDW